MTTTLEHVRKLAHQLTTQEKAQLISDLAHELAAPAAATAPPGDPHALVAALRQVGRGKAMTWLSCVISSTPPAAQWRANVPA